MRISDWSSYVCSSVLGDHGFTAAAVALGIGPEAGQIDDGEFRHEIGKLARLWADQQRANEQIMPCQFVDDTHVDAVFRLGTAEQIRDVELFLACQRFQEIFLESGEMFGRRSEAHTSEL